MNDVERGKCDGQCTIVQKERREVRFHLYLSW